MRNPNIAQLETAIHEALSSYGDTAIDRLRAIADARIVLRHAERNAVRRAQNEGYGTTSIGRALRVSAEAVRRRHGATTPRPKA